MAWQNHNSVDNIFLMILSNAWTWFQKESNHVEQKHNTVVKGALDGWKISVSSLVYEQFLPQVTAVGYYMYVEHMWGQG